MEDLNTKECRILKLSAMKYPQKRLELVILFWNTCAILYNY